MKHIKLFESFIDKNSIEMELRKYRIENYIINDDGSIDVNGDVDLREINLDRIPFKFGKVTGSFNCWLNNLTSLDGCPYYVGVSFKCNENKLLNLIGGPEEVGNEYWCANNKLTSLEGIAAEIGWDLVCNNNQLTDLNISSNIGGNIYCVGNKIDPNNYQFYGECKKIVFKI